MPMKNSPRRRDVGDTIEEVVVSTTEPMKEIRGRRKRKIQDDLEEDLDDVQGQVVIQSAEGRSQVVIRGTDGSIVIQDIAEDDPIAASNGGQHQLVETEAQEQFVLQTDTEEVINGEEVVSEVAEYNDSITEDEEEEGLVQERSVNSSDEAEEKSEMVIQVVPKKVCHGFLVAKSVKEFKDLGRDMLRIHAENHGIEHASKLRMSDLVREMIQHYNGVHDARMEVSKLDQLKLNMIALKKIKVDTRAKTPPPDITKLVPKNVVPLEEQVHHVYEKRPDICTVDIIVNNLKDMLALGTSILRPEASKHRVCNSSRKQKLQVNFCEIVNATLDTLLTSSILLQVVEELWEHYLKFHLKDTEQGGVIVQGGKAMELVGEEYVEYRYQDTDGQECIVVSEGDLVAGEDIHTAAEEVTA